MDHQWVLESYTAHMRRDAHVPGMTSQQLPEITRYLDSKGREGLIMWHEFDETQAVKIVERELAYFTQAAQSFNWKVYAEDKPDSLAALLEKGGLKTGPTNALMLCEAQAATKLKRDAAIQVRAIEPQRMWDLYEVWEAVWPGQNDGWVPILTEALQQEPSRLKVLVAYDDGQPVAGGYIVLDPRKTFAYLGGGSALPSHRGRGYYRALIAERAKIAHKFGTQFLTVEAGPENAPMLSRMGFEALTELRFFQREKE